MSCGNKIGLLISFLLVATPYCHSFCLVPTIATTTSPLPRLQDNNDTGPLINNKNKIMSACSAARPTDGTKCVPCEGLDDSARLSLDQVQERLTKSFPLWTVQEKEGGDVKVPYLSRKYVARNFQAALDSINKMGEIAEQQGHHPDFHLTSYRSCQIDLYTHSLGGITENDLALAALLDAVEINYSPKWLKEHPEAAAATKTT